MTNSTSGKPDALPAVSLALIDSALTRPVIDGRIRVEGAALNPIAVEPADLFFRQLRNAEFDCSELSLASLFIKYARGDRTWSALPVFTSRNFYHTMVLVRRGSGIRVPADLRGKRVGVPEYQQTAAVWARGVLAEDYNVQPSDIEWYMERLPTFSHAFSTGSAAPSGVKIHHIPASTSIVEMLAQGTLDATLFYFGPTTLDRSVMSEAAKASIVPLFEDRVAEGRRFFEKRGFIPVNHGMVLRRSLVVNYPWLPRNIYSAMLAARQVAESEARASLARYVNVGLLPSEFAHVFEAELMPYGFKENRLALHSIASYLHEQGLTEQVVSLEDLFAPVI